MSLKLYLHDATAPHNPGGTLPGGTNVAGLTINVTATGASTNRWMNHLIGTSQVSQALTTAALSTAIQTNWFRRLISDRLEPQTIAAQTIQIQLGASESNANSDMFENGRWYLAIWRPATGAVVQALVNDTGLWTEPGTSETNSTKSTTSTAGTAQGGDILVLELFSAQQQAMAVGYTNTVFYDGTTEGSTTSNAAFLLFANDVQFQTLEQSANFASTTVLMGGLKRAWHRRKSGIFVPRLWLPEGAVI